MWQCWWALGIFTWVPSLFTYRCSAWRIIFITVCIFLQTHTCTHSGLSQCDQVIAIDKSWSIYATQDVTAQKNCKNKDCLYYLEFVLVIKVMIEPWCDKILNIYLLKVDSKTDTTQPNQWLYKAYVCTFIHCMKCVVWRILAHNLISYSKKETLQGILQ